MIISDLNHLEVVSEETSVVGGFGVYENGSANFTERVNINKNVSSNVFISGHLATAEADSNATGYGTLAETFTKTNTSGYSSSANSTSIAGTSGGYYYIW